MCGILGCDLESIQRNGLLEEVELGLKRLNHRGPDFSSYLLKNNFFLGHTRLAVLDLTPKSNQPIKTKSGRYTIAFNGEIYNYKELFKEHCSSEIKAPDSDTEVLSELWEIMAEKCLVLLDGMFSIVVIDNKELTITLARDFFGIKPLYIHQDPFIVCSEINPILLLTKKAYANDKIIFDYLYNGQYEHTRKTFFKGINSIKPGSYNIYDLNTYALLECNDFYSLNHLLLNSQKHYSGLSCLELTELTNSVLKQACVSALVSDVPVCINLSGGVDSSLLFSYAKDQNQLIHGFTQYYPNTEDAKYIQMYDLGYSRELINITPSDILSNMREVMHYQAEPFGGFATIGFSILYKEVVKAGYKVVLDGNGLDEIFLGYGKYLNSSSFSKTNHHDGTYGLKPQAINESYLVLNNKLNEFTDNLSVNEVRLEAIKDLLFYKLPRALRFNDRVSMQHSVELRVPFLRKNIAELGFAFQNNSLIDTQNTKLPIRQILASRTLNEDHAFARKASVQVPQTQWLFNQLKEFTIDILSSEKFLERPWINPDFIKTYLAEDFAREPSNGFYVWQWINLEIWAQSFLD